VDTTEPEEPVDIPEVLKRLNELETKRKATDEQLNLFLEELGYQWK